MNKIAVIEPINLLVGFVALIGAVAFLINKPDYGLILIIVSTLMEAIARIVR